jgi:hypothetical protein
MKRRRAIVVATTIPHAGWIARVLAAEGLRGWRVERGDRQTFTETWRRRIVLSRYDCQPGVGEDYDAVDAYLLAHGDRPTGPGADVGLTTRTRAAILHEMAHACLRPRNLPTHGRAFSRLLAGLLRRHAPEVYRPYLARVKEAG